MGGDTGGGGRNKRSRIILSEGGASPLQVKAVHTVVPKQHTRTTEDHGSIAQQPSGAWMNLQAAFVKKW